MGFTMAAGRSEWWPEGRKGAGGGDAPAPLKDRQAQSCVGFGASP